MSALLSVTFGDPFAEIAALNDDWPNSLSPDQHEALLGKVRWAGSYWTAASLLYATRDIEDFIMFAGPVMQNAGLACELVFKCLLLGGGHSDKDVRKLGHSLSKLYDKVENQVDIMKFLDAVVRASQPIQLPDEIAHQFIKSGSTLEETDIAWRVFSQHIRLLNESYDRPFRARYNSEGPIFLPEPYILLIGSLILLNAMNERLDLKLVGTVFDQPSEPLGA